MTYLTWILLSMLVQVGVSRPPDLRIDSWSKGSRQVKPASFDLRLDADSPPFKVKVADAKGHVRYILSVHTVAAGSISIERVVVSLQNSNRLANAFRPPENLELLKPSNDPDQDYFSAVDMVGIFDPSFTDKAASSVAHGDDLIPRYNRRRVVKVQSFYVILALTEFELVGQPALFHKVRLHIELTNALAPTSQNGTQQARAPERAQLRLTDSSATVARAR